MACSAFRKAARPCAWAVAVSLAMTSLPATAVAGGSRPYSLLKKDPGVTPEQARATREPIQDRTLQLMQTDPQAAGMELDRQAAVHGDPILFLDAADAYHRAGEANGEVPLLLASMERARIALDILHFMNDPQADTSFRLVDDDEIVPLIQRANDRLAETQALVETVLGGGPAPDAAPAPKKKKTGNGRTMVIAGAGLSVLGVGFFGLGIGGLAVGQVNQNKAEDPTVYGSEYDEFETKGKRGNKMAIAGLVLGAVFAGAGIALILLGKQRQKQAPKEKATVRLSPTPTGVTLHGRF